MKAVFPILIAVTALTAQACTRKPPEKFKPDSPVAAVPGNQDKGDPTAAASALSRAGGLLRPGSWNMTLDRTVWMRTNTMATTEVTATVGLVLDSATDTSDATRTRFSVKAASADVKSIQGSDAAATGIQDRFEGLDFTLTTLPGGTGNVEAGENSVPAELADALMLMIPALPEGGSGAPWKNAVSKKMPLPGEGTAVRKIEGQWRHSGKHQGADVFVFDYRVSIAGASGADGIKGDIRQGEGVGRVITLVDESGLLSSEMTESTAVSVELREPGTRPKMLEHKVGIRATLTRR